MESVIGFIGSYPTWAKLLMLLGILVTVATLILAPHGTDSQAAKPPLSADTTAVLQTRLLTAEQERDRLKRELDARPTVPSSPSSAQAAPLHDAEWKRIRQEANRDVSIYLEGPFQKFANAARDITINGSKETVGVQLRRVENLKALLASTLSEQSRMLRRYNGIADVFDMTDWNVLSQKIEPAIDEYISTLKPLPQGEAVGKFDSLPSASRFSTAMEQLPKWINDTDRALGNKRAELEKIEVHK